MCATRLTMHMSLSSKDLQSGDACDHVSLHTTMSDWLSAATVSSCCQCSGKNTNRQQLSSWVVVQNSIPEACYLACWSKHPWVKSHCRGCSTTVRRLIQVITSDSSLDVLWQRFHSFDIICHIFAGNPGIQLLFRFFRILASVSVQIVDRQREINHFYIIWYRVNCTIILYALQGIQRELLNTPQISSNVLPLCKGMQRRFTWATLLNINTSDSTAPCLQLHHMWHVWPSRR